MKNKYYSDLAARIDYGVRKGIANALLEHKKAGLPIVVSENGKIIEIPPDQIEIPKLPPNPLEK